MDIFPVNLPGIGGLYQFRLVGDFRDGGPLFLENEQLGGEVLHPQPGEGIGVKADLDQMGKLVVDALDLDLLCFLLQKTFRDNDRKQPAREQQLRRL